MKAKAVAQFCFVLFRGRCAVPAVELLSDGVACFLRLLFRSNRRGNPNLHNNRTATLRPQTGSRRPRALFHCSPLQIQRLPKPAAIPRFNPAILQSGILRIRRLPEPTAKPRLNPAISPIQNFANPTPGAPVATNGMQTLA